MRESPGAKGRVEIEWSRRRGIWCTHHALPWRPGQLRQDRAPSAGEEPRDRHARGSGLRCPGSGRCATYERLRVRPLLQGRLLAFSRNRTTERRKRAFARRTPYETEFEPFAWRRRKRSGWLWTHIGLACDEDPLQPPSTRISHRKKLAEPASHVAELEKSRLLNRHLLDVDPVFGPIEE